jgi:hypothetical protein
MDDGTKAPERMIRTRDKLAAELRTQAAWQTGKNEAKADAYWRLANRAETGEFDDYADVHVCGPTELHRLCIDAGLDRFARRVASGEFDATLEESEEWARSQDDPQIVAMMRALGIGPDRTRDQ